MIDNKPLEDEAESFIKNKLLRYGFNLVKPTFDILGADLLILDNIDNQYSKILKIQSKGRTLKSTSNSIKIHESYITNEFIVFLYAIDDEDKEKEYLFTFFKEDIEKWTNNNEYYTLSFTKKSVLQDIFQSKLFNKAIADKIKIQLYESKIKKYTSVIIDGIFIEKAIKHTFDRYSKIYPEKNLVRPSINDVVLNITLMYNRFTSKEQIINYHIYNYNEEADYSTFISGDIILDDNQVENRIYYHDTNGFIFSKVEEHFQKIINIENIILAADDVLYEPILQELQNNNIDVILVRFSDDKNSRMFNTHYRWGDIMYPIAQAMGVTSFEW
ncbi:MAG: hypothetical protein ACJAWW_001322 [Sulfurimonas sp.]